MPTTLNNPIIDIRRLSSSHRHPTIFGLLTALTPGSAMQVLSDHDPRPLHDQIETRYPEQFDWAYLEEGPEVWRVEIKRQESSGCDGCCGNG